MKIQIAFLCLIGATWVCASDGKDKRQVGSAVVDNKEDHQGAESAFGHHVAASGKYFQYTHVPAKDHYEFGHKRGNEHHFIERHEKAHPHQGEFKTKVRWGDKHGGYGEHYWDYNHAGHHDGSGEESQQEPEYANYEESKQVPSYSQAASTPKKQYLSVLPAPSAVLRGKREPGTELSDDVEFIDDRARSLYLSGASSKHGGNYKAEPKYERGKREGRTIDGRNLVFEPSSGLIVDEKTGIAYRLQAVDDF